GLEFGIGKPGIDRAVELVDDFRRRAPWGANALPADALVAGHELAYGREVREQLRSSCARHRQGPHRTSLDLFGPRDNRAEHDLDAPGDEFGYGRAIAAIMHSEHIDTGHHLEKLPVKVR